LSPAFKVKPHRQNAGFFNKEIPMVGQETHMGKCFCGGVAIAVSGEPAVMGYCHCSSCREWSAGPVNAFTLWKASDVQITKGSENLGSYSKTPQSIRRWCKICGGHVLTEHPSWGLIDVYAAVIPTLAFNPGVHVHYQETVLRIKDGLPKQKDVPAQMGGSGTLLAE
jgi:hypothetical protein